MTRVVAVDWSGRAKRPEESIWTAEVRDGRLVDLRNSRTGGQVVEWLPHLLTLAERGFCVWPFEGPGWPLVVEIYPRALTGPVVKSRWTARRTWLLDRFPDQPRGPLERAAGSEDAFDAAVSALAMGRHADELAALPRVEDSIEGRIWRPAPLGPPPRRG